MAIDWEKEAREFLKGYDPLPLLVIVTFAKLQAAKVLREARFDVWRNAAPPLTEEPSDERRQDRQHALDFLEARARELEKP